MKNARVLITGGAGFLGRNITRGLIGLGNEVVIFDNLSFGCKPGLSDGGKVTWIEGDVQDEASMCAAAGGCDAIFHYAGVIGGDMSAEIASAHNAWMAGRSLPEETRLYAHGQGCEMVERPLIRHDETLPLARDMLLAVHPGYDDGRVFAVICDNYLIEADGPGDCLHRTDKKVFEI